MKKLIAGNWKMNNTLEEAVSLASDIADGIAAEGGLLEKCDFAVFPPFVHIADVKSALDEVAVAVGGQNCAATDNGAYTGEVSVAMLQDIGCSAVILGHSERREYFKESNTDIAAKAVKAHEKGLVTIICVGEIEAEREAGKEVDIVGKQLKGSVPSCTTAENTVIAYEPVWAIGTGKVATIEDIKAMHALIRKTLGEMVDNPQNMRILYGGSVKPSNAAEIFATENVDGALIGGASLKAEDYLGIAQAA